MSLSRHLLRRIPSGSAVFRPFSTVSSPAHRPQHEFVPPNPYINSWKTPRNPKEAAKQLALLRRDYDRKVKEIRKDYINEMEMVRLEKLRKDEARKEALRIAKEERAAAKAAKKKADATDRHAAEQEFRQMLVSRIPLLSIFHFRCNCCVDAILSMPFAYTAGTVDLTFMELFLFIWYNLRKVCLSVIH